MPGQRGKYIIYYYDSIKHAFYINDLEESKSSHSTLEIIINKAYRQEMNSFVDLLKQIQIQRTPQFFRIAMKDDGKAIEIETVKVKVVRQ